MADDKAPPEPPQREEWEDPDGDEVLPEMSDEDRKRMDEARKFWDRPDVQRALERIARGEPPIPEDDGEG